MFMHASLTEQQLSYNSKACLSQTELLKHFMYINICSTDYISWIHTEYYSYMNSNNLLNDFEIRRKDSDIF